MRPEHVAELDSGLADGECRFLDGLAGDGQDSAESGLSSLTGGDRDAAPTTPLVAVLYWFSPRLGFGFAVTADGQDLLMSAKVAVASLGRLPVIGEVLTCAVENRNGKSRITGCQDGLPGKRSHLTVRTGKVRSFDPRRGYGFLRLVDGADLFVGAQEMRRMGVRPPLRPGQVVTVVTDQSQAGEEKIVRMVFSQKYPTAARGMTEASR